MAQLTPTSNPPVASIVVPAFNVAKTIAETLETLLAQTVAEIEILIIDDGSTDETANVVDPFLEDDRVRYIKQANRGLAGARNTGIAEAKAPSIGFCDADDLWHPDKLRRHLEHLNTNPEVGVSYSGSQLIDDASAPLRVKQTPRLRRVNAAQILKRNPVGNGSAMVIRKQVFDDICFYTSAEPKRRCYFDETFRQSEDIECWIRMALTTDWAFEGIPGLLTLYRVAAGGLSSNTDRQLASWENVITKLRPLHPVFFEHYEPAARAYQLRYLARRAVSSGDGATARRLVWQSYKSSKEPFFAEPAKTLTTGLASLIAPLLHFALRRASIHQPRKDFPNDQVHSSSSIR